MRLSLLLFCIFFKTLCCVGQTDSADVEAVRDVVVLSEVVVRSDLNVPRFLSLIKNDTTFYKAFKNLRVLGFTSVNNILMLDKKGAPSGSLISTTKQVYSGNCRTMEVLSEVHSGDIYNKKGAFNYYTAQLYSSLFFTKGKVCGGNNIVKGVERAVKGKSGIEKSKEQLKLLFFNPGKKIDGIPFIGDKLDVFDKDVATFYDFIIDIVDLNGEECYLFSITKKADLSKNEKDKIVYNNILTWFNKKTFEIVARTYDLSYNAGVYDFDVHMNIEMTHFGEYLLPKTIQYWGNWDVPLKKRERGVFTAQLSDFNKGF